jgi:hypothetical protein
MNPADNKGVPKYSVLILKQVESVNSVNNETTKQRPAEFFMLQYQSKTAGRLRRLA